MNELGKMSSITMVETKKLRPHPKNPRKRLGDLTELVESIKENGIMQNLTAVPDPDKDDGYMIIIGHRRFAAGKKAGLKEFPVSIVSLDEADQVKLMLCENIQRSDLTPVEQAEGFQMMIDFGFTVDELSQNTGFAPSTIYHRLNIAKLDKDALKKKMDQLTLTDLIDLEQIEDVQVRNEILRKANRQTFAQCVQSAVNDQKMKHNEEAFVERLKAAGLTEREANSWDRDIDNVRTVYISAASDCSDVDPEGYEHYAKSKYTSCYLLYSMKVESAEEDKKSNELEKKIDDLRDLVGEAKDELDAIALDMFQEVDAFVAVVCKGEYIKEKRDEFLTACFMLDITEAVAFDICRADAVNHDAYGIKESWEYQGSIEDWRDQLEAAVRERYGNDPITYAVIALAANLRGNYLTKGWADGILSGRTVFYNDLNAKELTRAIKALEIIGFKLEEDLKKYLDEDNEIVKRVEMAKAEYSDLIGVDEN